jgi:hypothetical protein
MVPRGSAHSRTAGSRSAVTAPCSARCRPIAIGAVQPRQLLPRRAGSALIAIALSGHRERGILADSCKPFLPTSPQQSRVVLAHRSSALACPSAALARPSAALACPFAELARPSAELACPSAELARPSAELTRLSAQLTRPFRVRASRGFPFADCPGHLALWR